MKYEASINEQPTAGGKHRQQVARPPTRQHGKERRSPAGRRHAGTRRMEDGPRVSSEISMCHSRSGGLRIEFPGGNQNAETRAT